MSFKFSTKKKRLFKYFCTVLSWCGQDPPMTQNCKVSKISVEAFPVWERSHTVKARRLHQHQRWCLVQRQWGLSCSDTSVTETWAAMGPPSACLVFFYFLFSWHLTVDWKVKSDASPWDNPWQCLFCEMKSDRWNCCPSPLALKNKSVCSRTRESLPWSDCGWPTSHMSASPAMTRVWRLGLKSENSGFRNQDNVTVILQALVGHLNSLFCLCPLIIQHVTKFLYVDPSILFSFSHFRVLGDTWDLAQLSEGEGRVTSWTSRPFFSGQQQPLTIADTFLGQSSSPHRLVFRLRREPVRSWLPFRERIEPKTLSPSVVNQCHGDVQRRTLWNDKRNQRQYAGLTSGTGAAGGRRDPSWSQSIISVYWETVLLFSFI